MVDGGGDAVVGFEDGRVSPKTGPQAFPYPVFGRFADSLSALDVHYLLGGFAGMQDFSGNVRPYQTDCSRTAGHRISEKPEALFRGWPWFWMWVVASCNSW